MERSATYLNKNYMYDDLDVTVLHFMSRSVLPFWNSGKTKLEYDELIYIKSGKAVYYINDKRFSFKKGDLIYIPTGSIYEAHTEKGYVFKSYVLNFRYSYLNTPFRELPFSTVISGDSNTTLTQLYEELNRIWMRKDSGFRLKARAMVMQILHEMIFSACINRKNDEVNSRIDIVKEYIIDHYDKDMEIEELAALINLNPVYFGSYFKKKTGYTVRQYINRIRIDMAKGLLSSGGYSVGEAAYQCGFNDTFYFSKVFKQMEGIPPSYLLK